jgi:hypothetical protein
MRIPTSIQKSSALAAADLDCEPKMSFGERLINWRSQRNGVPTPMTAIGTFPSRADVVACPELAKADVCGEGPGLGLIGGIVEGARGGLGLPSISMLCAIPFT